MVKTKEPSLERRLVMKTTKTRLDNLRQIMKKNKVDMYLIPMSDFHSSEYVGDYFKEIEYVTGFTGTNATVVVTETKSGLWTDGRYFIQAKRELKGSGTTLYEMGEEGVPTVEEFIRKNLKKDQTLAYDGRVFSLNQHKTYETIAKANGAKISFKKNLLDKIWGDRPELPKTKLWELKKKYAGVTCEEKMKNLREEMKKQGAKAHLLTSLYDIAWLLNLRADDIASVPVFMSYFFLKEKSAVLYVALEAIDEKVAEYLKNNQIEVKEYNDIYKDLKNETVESVLIDPNIVNIALVKSFPKKTVFIEGANPTELGRSVKNKIEIKNTKEAHIKDGVAVTKFIYWLKHHIGKEEITEMYASDVLLNFRKQQEHFLDVSFDTIAAYGPNAAMMHYTATKDNNAVLKPKSFLLVDSGGHYLEGTTDITRTIALGKLTKEEKHAFTLVVRSNMRLQDAHFPVGCIGANLDILARGPVWDEGLDYRCGTGHGVGHILNVHEGPQSFRWRVPDKGKVWELRPGMITTDEPGLYVEDGYGIRIENELLCVTDQKTEYGQFLKFEQLTYAPIERDAINPEELTHLERKALNDYHAAVYEKISPYLTKEEAQWLKEVTAPI